MRNLFLTSLILLGLVTSNTFANGYFEFGLARFMDHGQVGPSIAVGLHEPLLLGMAYESWNGLGVNVRDNVWATSKHDLVVNVSDGVDFSLGVALRHNDVNYSDVHASVKFRLWD